MYHKKTYSSAIQGTHFVHMSVNNGSGGHLECSGQTLDTAPSNLAREDQWKEFSGSQEEGVGGGGVVEPGSPKCFSVEPGASSLRCLLEP